MCITILSHSGILSSSSWHPSILMASEHDTRASSEHTNMTSPWYIHPYWSNIESLSPIFYQEGSIYTYIHYLGTFWHPYSPGRYPTIISIASTIIQLSSPWHLLSIIWQYKVLYLSIVTILAYPGILTHLGDISWHPSSINMASDHLPGNMIPNYHPIIILA